MIKDTRLDDIERIIEEKKASGNIIACGTSSMIGKNCNDSYGNQTNIEINININIGERVDLETLDRVMEILDGVKKIKQPHKDIREAEDWR